LNTLSDLSRFIIEFNIQERQHRFSNIIMTRPNPLFTTTRSSVVWFCCIASLCSKQSFALQPHHGRPRSSPRNFNNNNGRSKARSFRMSPLTHPSSPLPSVRVDYASFRTLGEFEEFRNTHATPGAATTMASGATQQHQQPQRTNLPLHPPAQAQPEPSTNKLSKRTQQLVTVGCVLAANAGFMNGVGLSGIVGKAQGISAVTGAFTTAGIATSRAGLTAMATVLLTPFSYMLGSFTNGLWNPNGVVAVDDDKRNNDESSSLRTGPLLLSATMLMLGNGFLYVHPLAVLTCWTFAMGLQNSWTSALLKGNVLRSTHFSGITSDIGTILGQTLRGNQESTWKLPIFAKLTASFWAGGIVSAFLGLRLGVSASTCAWMSTYLYLGMWGHLSQKVPQQLLQQVERRLLPSKLKHRFLDHKPKVAHVM
jgi:uncharacterized membrane protein YoaK (UPF0700 family)